VTRLVFYTGTDANMLSQAFILLQSLKETGAAADLVYCDFGLTAAQRRFLERRWRVITPRAAVGAAHPWIRKASLVDYMEPETEAAAWVDADMLFLADLRPLVADILGEMARGEQAIAACADFASLTLERYSSWCHGVGARIGQFTRELAQRRISGTHDYLNSGFFVARSRRWLKDWKQLTLAAQREEYLFEQNAFNITAWREPPKVRVLDLWRWNVHGPMLARIGTQDGKVTCFGRGVIGLHATSADSTYLKYESHTWVCGGKVFRATLRFFTNPALRDIQRGLFARFVSENPHLAEVL
jgi:hypothetical protein